MSRQNDPVADGIEKAGGAVAFGLIGIVFAAYNGWRHRKQMKEKGFKPPEGLVIDYDHPNYVAPQDRPWYVRQYNLWGGIAYFTAIGFGCAGFVASSGQSPVCFAFAIIAFVAMWYLRTEWKHYTGEHSTYVPAVVRIDFDAVQCYSITLPKDTKWRPEDAGRFMRQLLFKTSRLTFQIVADANGISWRVVDYWSGIEPSIMRQSIHAFYPDAEITHSKLPQHEFEEPFYRLTYAVAQQQDFINPIAYASEFKHFDPLANLVHEMDGLQAGERIVYTLAVTDPAHFVYHQARDALTIEAPTSVFDLGGAAYRTASGEEALVPLHSNEETQSYLMKLHNAVYQAVLFIQVDAASEQRAQDLLSLTSHLTQFDRPMYNQLATTRQRVAAASGHMQTAQRTADSDAMGLLDRWLRDNDTSWRSCRLLLDTQELGALWHLPHEHFRATHIAWTKGRQIALPNAMRGKDEGVRLGFNRYAGEESAVYLPDEDRATHMSVIGQTGSGKSTLLHNLIHADIAAGRGVAVIDPKGHLVRDILRSSIPPEREDDVVVLDVSETDHPPPFNLLAIPGTVEHSNAVELLLAVFEKLYPDFSGTRMADTFSMAVQTLWKADEPTLLDVERLFEDIDYRRMLVARTDNFIIRRFWTQFESRTPAQQDELAQPILHRMRAFYGNQVLLPMTCHPAPLDVFQLIRENKIILISLKISDAKLPPREQQLLGAVLISQIQMAAMSDAIVNPPFYLFIDEAQNFVTTSLPQMLTTARSSGLALVMANQHLKQLSGDTLDAVLGNVGAVVAFQVGESDARVVAKLRAGFTVDDLIQLDKHKAGVFMRYKGETQPAFSLDTLPPPEPPGEVVAKKRERDLRALSRGKYSHRSRQEIMDWLQERYAAPSASSPGDDRVDNSFYDQP